MRSIAVIGASLGAVGAVRALRSQGYDGRLTVIGDERVPAYDRPPLSKGYLTGDVGVAELSLVDELSELDVEWRLGIAATALRPGLGGVELADGTVATVDGVVLATGARARQPWSVRPGMHVVRTFEDATTLRAEMRAGARLVVVGAGYLGAEIASSAHSLGLDVTVVEAGPTPLAASLGLQVGAAVATLHAANGVTLLTGVGVAGFTGGHRVEGVVLDDERVLPADVVVVAVGAVPNVEWLAGSGLEATGGVSCDAYGMTSIPTVVAVGDCAAWHDPQLGAAVRHEHWTSAREQAGIASASLLSGGAVRTAGRPPYVWSDQYGVRLQLTGHVRLADSVTIEQGSLDDVDFLAVYRGAGEVVAAAAVGHASPFVRVRKQLAMRSRTPAPSTDVLSTV